MTEEQRETLRVRLEEVLVEVQQSLPFLTEASEPIAPSVALGRLTRMEAISEKGVNEEMLRHAHLRLERIINARTRMEQGTYGTCPRCNREIGWERLVAIPEAIFCVKCAGTRR